MKKAATAPELRARAAEAEALVDVLTAKARLPLPEIQLKAIGHVVKLLRREAAAMRKTAGDSQPVRVVDSPAGENPCAVEAAYGYVARAVGEHRALRFDWVLLAADDKVVMQMRSVGLTAFTSELDVCRHLLASQSNKAVMLRTSCWRLPKRTWTEKENV